MSAKQSCIRYGHGTSKLLLVKGMRGLGDLKLTLGGMMPLSSAKTVLITEARPAAPSRCPIFVFTEPIIRGDTDSRAFPSVAARA